MPDISELQGHDLSDWEFWKRRGFTDEQLAEASKGTLGGGQGTIIGPGGWGDPEQLRGIQDQALQAATPGASDKMMGTGQYVNGEWVPFMGNPSNPNEFNVRLYEGGPWDNPIPGHYVPIPGQKNAGVDPNTGLVIWKGGGDSAPFAPSPQSLEGHRATREQLAEWGITPGEGYIGGDFSPEEMTQIQEEVNRGRAITRAQDKEDAATRRTQMIALAAVLAAGAGGAAFGGAEAAGATVGAGAGEGAGAWGEGMAASEFPAWGAETEAGATSWGSGEAASGAPYYSSGAGAGAPGEAPWTTSAPTLSPEQQFAQNAGWPSSSQIPVEGATPAVSSPGGPAQGTPSWWDTMKGALPSKDTLKTTAELATLGLRAKDLLSPPQKPQPRLDQGGDTAPPMAPQEPFVWPDFGTPPEQRVDLNKINQAKRYFQSRGYTNVSPELIASYTGYTVEQVKQALGI